MSKRSSQQPSKSDAEDPKQQKSVQAELRQQQQIELVSEASLKIRQSLQLKEILHTAVTEVQRILQSDRVLIYHLLPDRTGKIVSEAVLPHYPALIDREFPEEVFPEDYQQLYAQGRVRAIADVHHPEMGLAHCLIKFVEQFGIKAKLIVPIVSTLNVHAQGISFSQNHLWGLLIAHQCHPRQWVEVELNLMQQLANQISIALSQAELLEHLGNVAEIHTAALKEANHNLQQETNLRIQAEATLRQSEAQLRLRDEVISVISHELRTPLTSLHSALKILATGRLGKLSPEAQQMLQTADDSTERLVRLVTNLLDLQRIESGQFALDQQACNAANLMAQATQLMQAMAQQRGVALISQPDNISIWADPDSILQVLINLFSNAIKFSSFGGTVWLTVAYAGEPPLHSQFPGFEDSRLQQALPNDTPHSIPQVVFRLRDQGQGIPADQLEHIFERFQQVNSSGSYKKEGTGLGLAICRKIIEQHNGKIWAESTLGCGSTFVFTLPALIGTTADGRTS